MKNIILIGPPGAGKGTQSKRIAEIMNFYHLSTGDLIRQEISKNSERGKYFSATIASGALLKDEDIFPIVEETIENCYQSGTKGIIYDGFPRTLSHASFLDRLFTEKSQKITSVVHISVEPNILLKRIEGRQICKICNTSYNIFFRKPIHENVCDFCENSQLEKRNDDNITSFNKRLKIYQDDTCPVLDFYKKQKIVQEINGEQSDTEVFSQLTKVLEQTI